MTTQTETYQAAVLACAAARELLRLHDLPALLRAIDHADEAGPIADPTLYRERAGAMHEDRDLMRAALELRDCKACQVTRETRAQILLLMLSAPEGD
jgi:hypothetical protein